MTEENATVEMTESTDQGSAESGVVLNVEQMQTMEIQQRFNRVKSENGWTIHILDTGRVTVNFITSMRKFETTLMAGDTIIRDGIDVIIIKNQPDDAYRTQRGSSSLARSREQLLSTEPVV